MKTAELIENLRALQSLVQEEGLREEAFDVWNEVKSHLPPQDRYELIVAWSRVVSSVSDDRFEYAAAKVISRLKNEDD